VAPELPWREIYICTCIRDTGRITHRVWRDGEA
jgi:hypothetical protein